MVVNIRHLFLLLAISLLVPTFANGATYYMATNGNDSTGDGSIGSPWLTVAHSLSHMAGGDTLIIGDGTYTGSDNAFNRASNSPPSGSSSAWTTIRAESVGGVTFDGENANNMFYFDYIDGQEGNRYWRFEGLIWARCPASNVHLLRSSYVKFLNCGAYGAGSGNNINFNFNRCSYVLAEGCYAYGTGRYKFLAYLSTYVIFRNCIGRPDDIDAGGEPIAVFTAYSSTYTKFQNCIAIDADQDSYWSNVGDRQGCFFLPSTDADGAHHETINSVCLNSKLGGLQTTGTEAYEITDAAFTNTIVWDAQEATGNQDINLLRGNGDVISNCTFGYSSSAYSITYPYVLSWDGIGTDNNTSIKNSIFYGILGVGQTIMSDVEVQDYNSYYANTATLGNTGAHDITATDPTAGSLEYLPRIETGSALKGAGESGADIGANVLTIIGTSETIWGETGYSTDTGVSMWPFPNEDLIKTKMAAYSSGGVSGARGFATGTSIDGSAQSLTRYIWEYLGNQIPCSIYGNCGGKHSVSGTGNFQ